MDKQKFKELICGPVTVVFTPFDEKGKNIDENALKSNVRYLIDHGIKNGSGVLVAGGSTGDCYVMSTDERKKVFDIIVKEANGEVPVICGCNHTSVNIIIELAKYAESIGADGVMVTPPYYWMNLYDDAIYASYKAISDAINIGIMIYNNPFIIGKDLSLDILIRLSELENIWALKECTTQHIKFIKVVENLSGRIAVINGAGEWMEPISYRLGTKAFISGFANFAPEICVGIHNESMKGNFQKATEIAKKLRPLQYLLGQYVQEIGSASQGGRMYKEMAILCGFKEGGPRLPIMSIPDSYREKLLKALTEGGFLRNDLLG